MRIIFENQQEQLYLIDSFNNFNIPIEIMLKSENKNEILQRGETILEIGFLCYILLNQFMKDRKIHIDQYTDIFEVSLNTKVQVDRSFKNFYKNNFTNMQIIFRFLNYIIK